MEYDKENELLSRKEDIEVSGDIPKVENKELVQQSSKELPKSETCETESGSETNPGTPENEKPVSRVETKKVEIIEHIRIEPPQMEAEQVKIIEDIRIESPHIKALLKVTGVPDDATTVNSNDVNTDPIASAQIVQITETSAAKEREEKSGQSDHEDVTDSLTSSSQKVEDHDCKESVYNDETMDVVEEDKRITEKVEQTEEETSKPPGTAESDINLNLMNVDEVHENTSLAPREVPSEIETVTTTERTLEISGIKNTPDKLPLESIPQNSTLSGLSLLAQYGSDIDEDANADSSETDSVIAVAVPETNNKYRGHIVEINSESDSESDTDSSSDSGSDVEYLNEIRKTIEKSTEANDDEEADDDEECGGGSGTRAKRQPLRVKGEFLIDDLPPIQDLHITVPEEECIELGKVHSIVDQLVLVNALPNSILLDLDTVLFLDKGQRVLGEIFDVLGQVADPLYCVRFNSNEQIKEKDIKVGDVVFVAPKTEYTQYVILSNLMRMRGSDASWENDVEPPPQYLAYSDDEKEKQARAKLRNRNRHNDHDDSTKRSRTDAERLSPSPAPSPSTSPSPSPSPLPHRRQPFNHYSPRGGRGSSRPPRYPHSSSPVYDRRPNYNSGSWHSNYMQPCLSPQSPNYRGYQSNFGAPQPFMYTPPPDFGGRSYQAPAMRPRPSFPMHSRPAVPVQGGPAGLMHPYEVPVRPNLQAPPPPLPNYLLNPYAAPPVVPSSNQHTGAMYGTSFPPSGPPPPGSH